MSRFVFSQDNAAPCTNQKVNSVNVSAIGEILCETSEKLGTAHKGQIFPFSLVTRLKYPINAGLLKIEPHSYLYVSRGSGTWGPPIRFLAPPEFTIFELVYQKATQ